MPRACFSPPGIPEYFRAVDYPRIYLKSKKDQSVRRFHPWVFSGAVKLMEGDPQPGDVVAVHANKGRFLGLGHYANGSIAVRLFAFEEVNPDVDFFIHKLSLAADRRKSIGLWNDPDTTCFRLVHGEGDGLPGLIIDIYDSVAVLQAHSIGMHRFRNELAEALVRLFEGRLTAVYDKSDETLRKSGHSTENGFIHGSGEAFTVAKEYGHKFEVNWETGQKTGFFIDQRENRKLLGDYAKDKVILNTFCYSGGFSIFALNHGAKEVHSLDSSQKALDLVTRNLEINGLENAAHENIKADALEHIKALPGAYDIIILDPPAFAKHKSARHNAVQGYKRLNAHAIRQIKPGGMIFTFSCSQAVDKALFNHTVTAAAISEGRSVKILHQLHQPADHPVNIFHPEGEYLKGLVIQVE